MVEIKELEVPSSAYYFIPLQSPPVPIAGSSNGVLLITR
jgi:hypothetical protein